MCLVTSLYGITCAVDEYLNPQLSLYHTHAVQIPHCTILQYLASGAIAVCAAEVAATELMLWLGLLVTS